MKFNLYIGAASSAILLTIMVILTEISAGFKGVLTSVFTHHWIAKVVVVFLALFIFGYLFRDKKNFILHTDEKAAWHFTLAALAIIFLFFVFDFLA